MKYYELYLVNAECLKLFTDVYSAAIANYDRSSLVGILFLLQQFYGSSRNFFLKLYADCVSTKSLRFNQRRSATGERIKYPITFFVYLLNN